MTEKSARNARSPVRDAGGGSLPIVRSGSIFKPSLHELDASLPADELHAALRELALAYLQRQAGFPDRKHWDEGRLRWLPIRGSAPRGDDPRWSFWSERSGGKGRYPKRPYDRTLVLLACISNTDRKEPFIAYGLGGVRVLLHVGPNRDGKLLVRITSAISTVPRYLLGNNQRVARFLKPKAIDALLGPKRQVSGFNLTLRIAPDEQRLEVSADEPPMASEVAAKRTVYRWDASVPEPVWRPVRSYALRTGATAAVVRRDPPTRFGAAGDVRPQDTCRGARGASVFQNAALVADARLDVPDPVYTSGPKLGMPLPGNAARRSHDSAAWQGQELFRRLDEYGIPFANLFKFAPGPLQILTFVSVGHGKDDRTINAEVVARNVLPLPPTLGGVAVPAAGIVYLQARFALAERHSSPDRGLALSCDPRWVWHEFAHVLIYGATNELEFAFAHSVGDALAAIRFDPDSQLRGRDPLWPDGRGISFPWVHIDRRHDRSVHQGWSWSGTMFRYPAGARPGHSHQFGYWAEQIMSTTLFKLYRCLGGDAVDLEERFTAADQAVYLIVQAIVLLAPDALNTSPEAVDFADALMNADIATSVLWLPLETADRPRLGGAAVKPIRWCFEKQGLYADPAASRPHNAPGLPPAVDVYIGKAAYLPMRGPLAHAFQWVSDGSGRWNLAVDLTLGNRGSAPATHVDVQAWLAFGNDPSALAWDPAAWGGSAGGWHPCPVIAPDLTIPARGSIALDMTFTGVTTAQRHHCFLLVALTCPDDLAIIDPIHHFPCSQAPGPLLPLLRGDNNLALFEVAP